MTRKENENETNTHARKENNRCPMNWKCAGRVHTHTHRESETLIQDQVLQVVSGLVLWLSGSEVVFQKGLDILKRWSLVRVFFPAQMHHLMQWLRAPLRTRHPVPPLHLLQDLPVYHACTIQNTCRTLNTWLALERIEHAFYSKSLKIFRLLSKEAIVSESCGPYSRQH